LSYSHHRTALHLNRVRQSNQRRFELRAASRAVSRRRCCHASTLARAEPLTALPRSARSRVSWSLAETRFSSTSSSFPHTSCTRHETGALILAFAPNMPSSWSAHQRRRASEAFAPVKLGRVPRRGPSGERRGVP